ncbi:MAG: TonB-dependent receptor [Sphingomonas sp.]|jgi:outer membrane receptor protein involved in Fe transport|uniref:TonB-dependent receptor n=1 Tax=Sphingomonas sp. TaxID=28214 RepID=UPI00356A0979
MNRHLIAMLATGTCIVAMAMPAQAQAATFEIPAGTLSRALDDYAHQTGRQIVYKADDVKGARSAGAHGMLTSEAALQAILAGTGFAVHNDSSGAIAIVRVGNGRLRASATAEQSAPAPAGNSAPEPTAEAAEVVVTGSRISRRDYKSDSPISTLDSAAITAAGQPSLDRAIGQMPQFSAAQGAAEVGDVQGSVGFGGGASYSDLRGIGRNRSLVLLDGRRMMPSTPDGAIDLNTIPMSLLDSVEVITGGASATYGSDAVAGVANFKLKQRFSGLELNVQHGGSFRGDGATTQVSGIIGGKFDDGRGHAILAFDYAQRDAVSGSQRAFFAQPSVRFLGRPPEGIIFAGGWGAGATRPSNAAVSAVVPGYTTTTGSYTGAIGVNTDQSIYTSAGSACAQNYKGVGSVTGDIISPDCKTAGVVLGNYFAVQVPLTKYNAFAKVDYDFSEHLQVYAQFNFSESSALDQTSPGSTKTSASAAQQLHIPVSNPFVQANPALLSLISSAYGGVVPANASFEYSKLLYGWGNRVETYKYDVWQALVGVKGDVPGTRFNWDLYASYGRSNYTSQAQGDISIAAINNVLANEGVGGCTWNPFGLQNVSAACLSYAGRTDNTTNVLTSKNVEFSVQGPLFALPGGDAKIALGADYRASDFNYHPDSIFITGDTLSYGTSTPSSGSQNTKELFGELYLPLLSDRSFVKDLSIDLGYRYSKYNTFSGKSTWKVDLSWQPVDPLRFRGGYSVAIRAPSLADLYAGQSIQQGPLPGGVDPCDIHSSYRTGANAAQVQSLCAAQSAAAGTSTYTYSGGSVSVQSGGNNLLQPENAKTWSAGAVLTPLRGLSISVDYYNISISGAISGLSAGAILGDCYGAITNPGFSAGSAFCQRISRDASTGTISNLVSGTFNFNRIKLDGVDFQLDYHTGLDTFGMSPKAGSVRFGTIVSYLRHYTVTPGDGTAPVEYAGGISDTLVTSDGENLYTHPHWKANTSLGYSNGPFNGTVRWRYIGKMANLDAPGTTVPGVSYFDFDAHYALNKHLTLSAGVNNIGDKAPPYIGSLELRTDAATYDVIGRTWYVAARVKF